MEGLRRQTGWGTQAQHSGKLPNPGASPSQVEGFTWSVTFPCLLGVSVVEKPHHREGRCSLRSLQPAGTCLLHRGGGGKLGGASGGLSGEEHGMSRGW